ncbi:hypothetical protein Tco_1486196 [Tanacetum coccineum]
MRRSRSLSTIHSNETVTLTTNNWNGYLRKGRKTKPNRQNRTRNGKAGKDKAKVQAKVNRSQPKSTPKSKSQQVKTYKFEG